MKVNDLVSIAKESFQRWSKDRAPTEAAALAYYTLLSVPAILLLIQWILGRVVSQEAQEQVIEFVRESVQGGGGQAITTMIENADSPGGEGGIATVASLAILALSATGVVGHLQQSLNRMWEIAEGDLGIVDTVRKRLVSVLLVLVLGAFLFLSATLSTVVSGFAETLTSELPFGEWTIHLVNIVLSLVLLTLLFGATMKIIPDAVVAWSDVWLGAAVTAVLFVVGQFALSFYLGKSAPGSAYGAAGSIVAFIVWVYYSALILFLGAEFTQVYANNFGSHIRPDELAITLEEKLLNEPASPDRPDDGGDEGEVRSG